MIRLGTILVPHDFSPHSDAALRRAVALARQQGGKIHLLHAYAYPLSLTVLGANLFASWMRITADPLQRERRFARATTERIKSSWV